VDSDDLFQLGELDLLEDPLRLNWGVVLGNIGTDDTFICIMGILEIFFINFFV